MKPIVSENLARQLMAQLKPKVSRPLICATCKRPVRFEDGQIAHSCPGIRSTLSGNSQILKGE